MYIFRYDSYFTHVMFKYVPLTIYEFDEVQFYFIVH